VLLFSIYTYRPSRIYIFDEVDSALDKDNSRLLSKLIKDMSKEAQFVVVSHNDSLVVDADAAIGVIKESAESNVVGVEIAELAKNR
jgi:chromosome segregation protein